MSDIRTSLIISVNEKEDLSEALKNSLLKQSNRNPELIFVSPSFSEADKKIISDLEKEFSLKTISDVKGLNAARNAALREASGEYILFVDSDSEVFDFALDAAYNKAAKYGLDTLRFMGVYYKKDKYFFEKRASLKYLRAGDFNRYLCLDDDIQNLKTSSAIQFCLYNRQFLIDNACFFDEQTDDDMRLFALATAFSSKYMCVHDKPVARNMKRFCFPDENAFAASLDNAIEALREASVSTAVIFKVIRMILADIVYYEYELNEYDDVVLTKDFTDFKKLLQKPCRKILDELRYEKIKYVSEITDSTLFHKKMDSPLVSVVVPTMNVEDYLNLALESLVNQSLDNMEFILLNDGSTDNSFVIMQEYAYFDKRFVLVDKKNSGYGNTMNMGIDMARGKYIGILEPDDYVVKKTFKRLAEVAERENLDFVKANFYRFEVNADGTLKKYFNKLSSDDTFYNRVLTPGDEQETFSFIMNTWSGIYNRDFLNKYHIRHNETPGASYQDNGFWFQTFCRAKRAYFIHDRLYMNRRDNPNSSMRNPKKVYCVTEEYKYIWNWLCSDAALKEKFSHIYYVKKLDNFFATYNRIDESFHREYLHHMKEEFADIISSGVLTKEDMNEYQWDMMNAVIKDPDAWYDNILISVIIPVYNGEKHIRQCIDSITIRREVRYEIIVVDDGSTDSTLDILREYEESLPDFHVITQQNAGAGAARNNGLRIAKGKYLSFLDADDFFELNMLRTALEKAENEDLDIVVFGSDNYFDDKKTYIGNASSINRRLLPKVDVFCADDVAYDVFRLFVGWAWDKLFRTDFIRREGLLFQEQRTSNDMLFVFSAVIKAERIGTVKRVLAHHRRGSGSLSVTREQSWNCFYNALIALREQLKVWGLYEKYEQDFINYCLHFILWNLHSIKGASYFKLYEKLQNEWLDELGLTDHDEYYFYHGEDFPKIDMIKSLTAEEYLFAELDEVKIERDENRILANMTMKEFNETDRQLTKTIQSKEDIVNSVSFKVGRKLTWPMRIFRDALK